MPTYPEERGKKLVLIDGILRESVNAGIDEKVKVTKTPFHQAVRVILKPIQLTAPLDDRYLGRLFSGIPVTKQMKVRALLFGSKPIDFEVLETTPLGAVLITPQTVIQIKGAEEKEEVEKRPAISYEDIGGLDKELQRIREMIELPLKYPQVFNRRPTKSKQVFNSSFGGTSTGDLRGPQPFFQQQPGAVAYQARGVAGGGLGRDGFRCAVDGHGLGQVVEVPACLAGPQAIIGIGVVRGKAFVQQADLLCHFLPDHQAGVQEPLRFKGAQVVLFREQMRFQDEGRGREQPAQGGMPAEDRGQGRGGARRGLDHALEIDDPGRGQTRIRGFIEKPDQGGKAAGLRPEIFIPKGEVAGRGQPAGVVAGLGRLVGAAVFQDGDLRESPFQPGKGGMLRLAGHHDDFEGHRVGLGQERVQKGEKRFGLGRVVDQADCQVGFNVFHDFCDAPGKG